MNANPLIVFIKGIAKSYSQIFFSESYWFAIPLIIVSFLDMSAGLLGLISVITANAVATLLKFDKTTIAKGLYGFNSLLIGLGLGYFYEATLPIILMAIFAGFLSLLITISIQGILGKYYLPYLSIPFVLSIWIVLSAGSQLNDASSNQSGVYVLNKLFSIGGINFVNLHEWWTNSVKSDFLNSYFISLGAIFFQFNVIAGVIVAISLLFYSRIAFLLSLIGYCVAYSAYSLLGMDLTQLGYSYIGFNFILGAIAIGGYFYIPSKRSFLWAFAITPVIALVTAGLIGILKQFSLPLFSLPFNIVILTFIYSFRFRTSVTNFNEVLIQEGTPEKNLYSFQSFTKRFPNFGWFQIKLPFYGEWFVSQGHNGDYTHQGDWADAWDFIIVDNDDSQFKNKGDVTTDYYCFGQNVIAPADGVVVTVEDGIEDNLIGHVNTIKNWGNTAIVKHVEGLYSKFSHLKKDSITVKVGDNVRYGTIIGKVGNSGRSPFPHLHFQLQATPYIGSKTLKFPIFAYLENGKKIKTYDYPIADKRIKSIDTDPILKNALNLAPGLKLNWIITSAENKKTLNQWEVFTTPNNKLYIHCHTTKSTAYFENDGLYFYFTHFEGNKKSLLYNFYLAAFRLPLVHIDGYVTTDNLPPNKTFKGWRLFLHDFIAPFYIYLKSKYEVRVKRIGSEFDTDGFEYETVISGYSINQLVWVKTYNLTVSKNRTIKFENNQLDIEAICEPY